MKHPRLITALLCLAALTAPVLADDLDAQAIAKSDSIVTGPKPKPITPPTQEAIQTSIDRGIEFLIADQNKDGSWGNATQTKGLNIYAHVPGSHQAFRAAVTALCVSAIIESKSQSPAAIKALESGEAWLIENLPKVRRQDPILLYNVWSHSYGIQALVRMHDRKPDDKDRIEQMRKLIKEQIGYLERYESINGGWGYYDFDYGTQRPGASSTSFVTATALVAFHEAAAIGVYAPEKIVKRGIDSIHRQRKNDFTYVYGEYLKMVPMADINRPAGSLGRSQACNIALRLHGDKRVTDHVLKVWLDRLIARNEWLGIGRKRPVPHEAWFQVAGYFYYYGHYYAALCIDALPKEDRPHFQGHIAKIMIDLQEKDGSWWDYPLYDYHQAYGTALTVMTLKRCLE